MGEGTTRSFASREEKARGLECCLAKVRWAPTHPRSRVRLTTVAAPLSTHPCVDGALLLPPLSALANGAATGAAFDISASKVPLASSAPSWALAALFALGSSLASRSARLAIASSKRT